MRTTAGLIAAVPSSIDARLQLHRVLESNSFAAPRREKQFLQYVVEETLEGRQADLKAFTIAQAVLGRGGDFDAQADPCVRLVARRLRDELERYYLLAGRNDPVVISIPKGTFVPVLELRKPSTGTADGVEEKPLYPAVFDLSSASHKPIAALLRGWRMAWLVALASVALTVPLLGAMLAAPQNDARNRTTVRVENFQLLAGPSRFSSLSGGVTDELVKELVSIPDLLVTIRSQQSTAEGYQSGTPAYVVQGSVQLDEQNAKSTARLVSPTDGAVLWAQNYEADLREGSFLDFQSHVARNIASAIAQSLRIKSSCVYQRPCASFKR